MANHKSALKRVKQDEGRKMRNKAVKTRVKSVVKAVRAEAAQNGENLAASLVQAQAVIDKASKKGVINKRTAARKISRLAKLTNKSAA